MLPLMLDKINTVMFKTDGQVTANIFNFHFNWLKKVIFKRKCDCLYFFTHVIYVML